MWELEISNLDFICLFKRWSMFIDWMMSVSHNELECQFWNILGSGVAHTTQYGWICNGQHPGYESLLPPSSLREIPSGTSSSSRGRRPLHWCFLHCATTMNEWCNIFYIKHSLFFFSFHFFIFFSPSFSTIGSSHSGMPRNNAFHLYRCNYDR